MLNISRSEVEFARANGINIAYQTFGDKDASPLILIMGLGSQMVLWDGEFCRQLAAGGYRVIRFDNRDVGRSSRLDHLGVPALGPTLFGSLLGMRVQSPYALED
ncbi:MAG: alpha/beta hydrolase, partial [Gammaproteobacteria bacterium]|nr:alpha/beta hydrolase [Gammaproteobacteria bacterium]